MTMSIATAKVKMEPSPPRKPKDLQFFEPPQRVKTPAKIISEAKNSLARPQLRTLNTKRPITPQDSQRKLFGEESTRDPSNRPPSAFSLGSRHFDSDRPVSGTRLAPLDHKPRSAGDGDSERAPKPPADPNRSARRPKQRSLQHSTSLDEPVTHVTGVPSSPIYDASEYPHPIHSRPQDGTQHPLDAQTSPFQARPETRSGDRQFDRVESGYANDLRENSAGSQRTTSAGKPGSAGRREEESAEEALHYNTYIGPLVEEMATHIKDKDPGRLSELSDELYAAMRERGWLGKGCKRRASILKTIFKLLDLDNPSLLLKLARIILALKVSGNNLTNVCKLVFKVSKEETHDVYFLEGNILDLLLELTTITDPTVSAEALVYAVGSLKFLSGNANILRHLVKHNALSCMAKLLKNINKMNNENGKSNDQAGHILVQLTAFLRNLADASSTRSQYMSLHLIEDLCHLMDRYHTDGDLMLNISRIFSKLTTNADCCKAVASQSSHFRSFVHLLKIYQRREDLVLRLCYILGNLTAKSDESRVRFFQQPKALETILTVFKHYLELDYKTAESTEPSDSTSGLPGPSKTEDVLIKVVRVLANLSINEDIGSSISTNESCIKLILVILERKRISQSEELVLNTIATVNNLSFYNEKNSAVVKKQLEIAQSLLQLMNVDNIEGMAEATRVFGNLSRERRVRDFLVDKKVDEMIVVMLDSGKPEVVFTAVGVLINLMADEDKRPLLKQLGGIHKLVEVLVDLGSRDWQLSSMVCQTLWNYSGKITSATACFGSSQAQQLADVLTDYLDEEYALDPTLTPDVDEVMRGLIREKWEMEFCPVASQLLRRIEAHSTDLEPLERPA